MSSPFPGARMADTDKTLQQLLQLKNSLLVRLKEVEALINQVQGFQAKLRRLEPKTWAGPALHMSPVRGRSLIAPSDVADKAEAILRKHGLPMTRSMLARELINQGVPLQGGDIHKNVGTILWRHRDRFVNLQKLGYWLRDVELRGVYSPADHKEESES